MQISSLPCHAVLSRRSSYEAGSLGEGGTGEGQGERGKFCCILFIQSCVFALPVFFSILLSPQSCAFPLALSHVSFAFFIKKFSLKNFNFSLDK
jgi:hypothetical protein